MSGKVCVLGYDRAQTRIVEAIARRGYQTFEMREKVTTLANFDVVVSFGYRHILTSEVLESLRRPVVNLHISYLPFNRGAHPNFWSFIDETPAGVSIHEIDHGIDTGPICYQKRVEFSETEKTFSQTYARLFREIEDLFLENIGNILNGTYTPIPQTHLGTYHDAQDLPAWMNDWDIPIKTAKLRYQKAKKAAGNSAPQTLG